MAGKKPWEENYEDPKEAEKEESGPWSDYVDTYTKNKDMDRKLGEVVPDYALMAASGAMKDHLDETSGFIGESLGGNYEETRDGVRKKLGEARDRIGIGADVAETAGSVASDYLIPGGPVVKELISSGLHGLGSADEMEDAPKQVGINAGITAVTHGLGGVVNKVFDLDKPNRILARTTGARGQDFLKGGVEGVWGKEGKRAPELIAKRLDDMGFFRQGEVGWSLEAGKWVPMHKKGSSRLDSFFKPQSNEDLYNRAMQTVSGLKQHNEELLKGKTIPMDTVANTLREAVNDYVEKGGYDYAGRLKKAQEIVNTVLNDNHMRGKIKRSAKNLDGLGRPVKQGERLAGTNMYMDAADVDQIKRDLYKEVEETFKQGKAAGDLSLGPEAQRKFSAKIDTLLDKYGGPKYKQNNDVMHDLLQMGEDMYNKISREAGYGFQGPRLTMGSQIENGFKDFLVNNGPAGVAQARLGQGLATPTGQNVMNGVRKLPVIQQGNQGEYGRKPNSINIPEELIRTPLPRTTDGMMKNKNFVLAKVAQMAPEMFEAVKDTYDREPEMLSEIAPVLAQKMPHLFERDKYNRFDGRVMSEQDKSRVIKDTLTNSQLNSIQQAQIITKLNKDGIYDG